jgi:hypothetical protein
VPRRFAPSQDELVGDARYAGNVAYIPLGDFLLVRPIDVAGERDPTVLDIDVDSRMRQGPIPKQRIQNLIAQMFVATRAAASRLIIAVPQFGDVRASARTRVSIPATKAADCTVRHRSSFLRSSFTAFRLNLPGRLSTLFPPSPLLSNLLWPRAGPRVAADWRSFFRAP